MRGWVLSIEALLSLLAVVGITALALNHNAPIGYEKLYAYELTQDFAEVLAKSPTNQKIILDWAEGKPNANPSVINLLSAAGIASLGNYCIELSAKEKRWKSACGCEPNNWVQAKRTFFDGARFFVLEVRLGYLQ